MKIRAILASLMLTATTAFAQPVGQSGQNNAPAPPREPPSNEQVGVNIDRFIGDPNKVVSHLSEDIIMTQAILTPGDPNAPGTPGATLRFRREVDLGTMQPGETTPVYQVPDQQVWYVESGEGRIDDGKQYWDLKPGIILVIPPNQAHRVAATGAGPLKMLMLSYDRSKFPAMTALPGILVRDSAKVLYTERNVHWNNFSKYLLNDIGERVYLVYLSPRTMAGPHAHSHDDEECWIKISDGESIMQLGSEIRDWPLNVGLEAPTTGQTVHAAINLSNKTEVWFYFAIPLTQRPANAPARPQVQAPNPNRPQINPAVAASAAASTIPGRPLPR